MEPLEPHEIEIEYVGAIPYDDRPPDVLLELSMKDLDGKIRKREVILSPDEPVMKLFLLTSEEKGDDAT